MFSSVTVLRYTTGTRTSGMTMWAGGVTIWRFLTGEMTILTGCRVVLFMIIL